ncbi:EscU/YscU/HrcU family type III secretion system export apparatus switch protein [Jannaschia seohaensis]|uniref:Flagellar biosynthetic protein FlhB n=1 Tax=Jannaschia seohaensis TaxID=475081 RepID=A0A2Y9ASQ7_9RHOB|nr:flagellar type III secretion system protein FlhB [Jannaschia seohaensis]PWJ17417.1 flagellar biosynthetic protein FlhB [Jannaschia seohaensis]SSA47480.1 flagellar biosynthetic protein FlhB [Jannaschia seohaensis]
MSGADDGAERSHEPTPQKLREARKKGEIVKSQDVGVAASYLGALLTLAVASGAVAQSMLDLGGTLLEGADRWSRPLAEGGAGASGAVLAEALRLCVWLVAPAALLVLASLIAQQAFVVAPSKLAPKLSRISPLANAKNKFGANGLFEFGKSALKMTIYSGLLVWFLAKHADQIVSAAALDPRKVAGLIPSLTGAFLIAVMIVSATIAVIDYAWQRHSHLAKNRMTRQEVLDEMKQSEGDPHLKARRQERARELATNKMLKDVPDAAVIVVNPTHYAVALKWSPTDPTPPVVVAKGVDEIAARIREIAAAHDIPIHRDPATARALHAGVKLGDPIDRVHFAAVAAAIRFAQEMREKARGRG